MNEFVFHWKLCASDMTQRKILGECKEKELPLHAVSHKLVLYEIEPGLFVLLSTSRWAYCIAEELLSQINKLIFGRQPIETLILLS